AKAHDSEGANHESTDAEHRGGAARSSASDYDNRSRYREVGLMAKRPAAELKPMTRYPALPRELVEELRRVPCFPPNRPHRSPDGQRGDTGLCGWARQHYFHAARREAEAIGNGLWFYSLARQTPNHSRIYQRGIGNSAGIAQHGRGNWAGIF